MEQSPYGSRRREEPELSMKEWALRAQISRENTKSRRFSGSHIRSFREEARSFRSSVTISSTASSPGYTLREENDPSTYSFTTALKALQAKSVYNSWECLSPDGFALNSKWNEAEKYICNPYSGEVPMECLSAKTLSGKSFRSLTTRITMSAPLVYSSNIRPQVQAKPALATTKQDPSFHLPIKENKTEGMTRDVATQSTPPELSSSSLSPASTPSIMERALKRCETEGGDSPNSNNAKLKDEDKVQEKETSAKEETTKREGNKQEGKEKGDDGQQTWRWCSRNSSSGCHGGCLPWMRKRQSDKHKPEKKNIFLLNHKGC